MAVHSNFKEVKKKKAFEIIYDQIREKILNGELAAGDKLPPERELIEVFQCSRPTIREALKMLASKNYVTISAGSGTVVNKLSTVEAERALKDMLRQDLVSREDLRALRNVCELISIKWASERRSEHDIEIMQQILDASETQIDDQVQFMYRGMEFNKAIARSTYNQVAYILTCLIGEVGFEINLPGIQDISSEKLLIRDERIISQHREMLDCIINKDAARAQESARQHINEVTQL